MGTAVATDTLGSIPDVPDAHEGVNDVTFAINELRAACYRRYEMGDVELWEAFERWRTANRRLASQVIRIDDGVKTIGPDLQPQINGLPFRCECGGNVFRRVSPESYAITPQAISRYQDPKLGLLRCNACRALYETEAPE